MAALRKMTEQLKRLHFMSFETKRKDNIDQLFNFDDDDASVTSSSLSYTSESNIESGASLESIVEPVDPLLPRTFPGEPLTPQTYITPQTMEHTQDWRLQETLPPYEHAPLYSLAVQDGHLSSQDMTLQNSTSSAASNMSPSSQSQGSSEWADAMSSSDSVSLVTAEQAFDNENPNASHLDAPTILVNDENPTINEDTGNAGDSEVNIQATHPAANPCPQPKGEHAVKRRNTWSIRGHRSSCIDTSSTSPKSPQSPNPFLALPFMQAASSDLEDAVIYTISPYGSLFSKPILVQCTSRDSDVFFVDNRYRSCESGRKHIFDFYDKNRGGVVAMRLEHVLGSMRTTLRSAEGQIGFSHHIAGGRTLKFATQNGDLRAFWQMRPGILRGSECDCIDLATGKRIASWSSYMVRSHRMLVDPKYDQHHALLVAGAISFTDDCSSEMSLSDQASTDMRQWARMLF